MNAEKLARQVATIAIAALAVVSLAMPVFAAEDSRIALVIGNADYADLPALRSPLRDAEAVAAALRDDGFSTVTVVANATRAELLTALDDLSKKAESADWALVYFAGHGAESDGNSYLIPVDARSGADAKLADQGVPLARVIAAAAPTRKLSVILFDAGRDNPFGFQLPPAGDAPVAPAESTIIAFAGKAGQAVSDGGADANSPFAAALLKNLATPGLEVMKFFSRVRDDVLAATDMKQQPFFYGSLAGEEFFFRPN